MGSDIEAKLESLLARVEQSLPAMEITGRRGDSDHPIVTKQSGYEWLKMLGAFILQTGIIVYWGTRLIDSHEARITAVEKAVVPIPQIMNDVSQVRETVGRIDERTKMIVDQTKH